MLLAVVGVVTNNMHYTIAIGYMRERHVRILRVNVLCGKMLVTTPATAIKKRWCNSSKDNEA